MRTQRRLSVAARKDRIAIEQQVVRGNRRAERAAFLEHVADRFLGRDVLEHDLQLRKIAPHRNQHLVDEYSFAIEHIDLRAGDFAVDQQRHSDALHLAPARGRSDADW